MRTVHCDERVIQAITAHAERDLPRECCGVLLGTPDSIIDSLPVENIADGTGRFELDPAGHIRARRSSRERGLALVGFYHSHPHSPAQPSARDLAEASYADHLYAIVSLRAGGTEFRLFELVDGAFEEVAVVTDRCR